MKAKNVLLIGHSHIAALWPPLRDERQYHAHFIEVVKLQEYANRAQVDLVQSLPFFILEKLFILLNLPLDNDIEAVDFNDLVKAHDVSLLLTLGGGIHTYLGLIQEEIEATLILDDDNEVATHQRILPYHMAYQYFKAHLQNHFNDYIRPLWQWIAPQHFTFIEYHPPCCDNDRILQSLDSTFYEYQIDKAQTTLTEPLYRYQLWQVMRDVARDICDEEGVTYFPVPDDMLLDGRYLKPEHFQNANHANTKYGRTLLSRIFV